MNRFQSNNGLVIARWMTITHSDGWLLNLLWLHLSRLMGHGIVTQDKCCRINKVMAFAVITALVIIFSLYPRVSVAASQPSTQSEVAKSETVSSLSGNLLVMGDSLSAAYGIETQQGWVKLLAQKLSKGKRTQAISVVNASISGETTSGGKQRFAGLLQKHQPRWVILELGANDALRGQNLRSTQSNLAQMIQQCQSQKPACDVLLLGIRLPTNYGPAYDQFLQKIYQDLAKKYTVLFDPFFLEPVALDPELMQQDGLHPNALAQPMILERLWPKIQKLLGLRVD